MKLPDNDKLNCRQGENPAGFEEIPGRAGGIARGRAAARLGAQRKHGAGADRKCGHNGFDSRST